MWLYIPREYCPSSPESLDSISEFGLFFQSQELFVTLSGKATQRPYSWRGWKTRPWMKLLSGMTLQPSMQKAGMELWIQSLLASRASQSQSQANEQESRKGQGQGCSLKPAELFAKYDQGIFLSKTSQDSFLTDSCQSYSESFPKWGSMRSGECFRQGMWEAPILEKESLSWPTATTHGNYNRKGASKHSGDGLSTATTSWGTPTVDAIADRKNKYAQGGTPIAMQASSWATPQAFDMNDCQRSAEALARAKTKGGCKNLREEVTTWRTPSASDPVGGVKDLNSDKYKNAEAPKIKLRDQSASWPTPNTSDQHNPNMADNHDVKKSYLRGVASSWPTPRMNDFKGHCTDATTRKDGKCRNDQLQNAAIHTGPSAQVNESNGSDSSKSAQTSPQPLKNWETPKVQMGEDCPSERRRNSPNLKSQTAQMATGKKRLNPNFVEWLMGVPVGWSLPIPIDQNDYKRWETESCHLLRLLHSASYGNE